MEITEVRVKLIMNPSDRLKAFCSVTFDGDFVIRDIKIIEGSGGIFVAMPSRKLSDHCPKCRSKNHLRASYCNECGASLGGERVGHDRAGRKKLHADIAHPINSEYRRLLQERVVEAFEQEMQAAEAPDYKPLSDLDEDDEVVGSEVVGSEVVGSEVVGSEVVGSEVVGSEVVGSEVAGSEVAGSEGGDGEGDVGGDGEGEGDVGGGSDDYSSMIDDLKKDAADRRSGRNRPRVATPEPAVRPAEPTGFADDEDPPFAEAEEEFEEEDEIEEEVEIEEEEVEPEVVEASVVVEASPPPQKETADRADESVFGFGLDDEPKPVAAPTRKPNPPPAKPVRAAEPAPVDEMDDFGSGIV